MLKAEAQRQVEKALNPAPHKALALGPCFSRRENMLGIICSRPTINLPKALKPLSQHVEPQYEIIRYSPEKANLRYMNSFRKWPFSGHYQRGSFQKKGPTLIFGSHFLYILTGISLPRPLNPLGNPKNKSAAGSRPGAPMQTLAGTSFVSWVGLYGLGFRA